MALNPAFFPTRVNGTVYTVVCDASITFSCNKTAVIVAASAPRFCPSCGSPYITLR